MVTDATAPAEETQPEAKPKPARSRVPAVETLKAAPSFPERFEDETCGDCRAARADKAGALYCFREPPVAVVRNQVYTAETRSGEQFMFVAGVRAQVGKMTPACGRFVPKV